MRLLPTGLTYFLEVARTGSVSEAAVALIRRKQDGQTVWLAQWNDKWQAYHFVSGQKRLDETHQIGALLAQNFSGIPMYILPDVSAWRSDKIAGPIGVYNEHGYGLFYNMNKWYTVGSGSTSSS